MTEESQDNGQKVSSRSSLKNRLAYWYDNFISQGAMSKFITLLIFFIVALFICFLVSFAINSTQSFFSQLWLTFMLLWDPGTLADAKNMPALLKMISILASIFGIIIFSMLVAFLTTTFDQQFQELRKGRSAVVEEDHTLILGWNDKVVTILKELFLANESESDAKAVILSTRPKEELEDYLKTIFKDTGPTRVIIRSGQPSRIVNQEKVAIETAKSVIIVTDCKRTGTKQEKSLSDTQIIKSILTICRNPKRRQQPFNIVGEIYDPQNIGIAKSIGGDEVRILQSNSILSKVLAQTSRQNGLAGVYSEIFSFDGNEIYCRKIPELKGVSLRDAIFQFPECVPIGVVSDGKAKINPSLDTVIKEDDQLIIVAEDDSTIKYKQTDISPTSFELPKEKREVPKKLEKYLILGWNDKSEGIIREYDEYMEKGSSIDVVIPKPSEEVRAIERQLKSTLKKLKFQIISKDYRLRDELISLNPFSYDNITILATEVEPTEDIDEIDSQTIYTLLLLRDMQETSSKEQKSQSQNTRLITEVLDFANQELIQIARVNDVVISDHLISMMLAQISEQQSIYDVYEDLLAPDGSEVYLKPAYLYFETLPAEVNFYDIIDLATQRGEIPFGYRLQRHQNSSQHNFGITVNPDKNQKVLMEKDDQIIVVSEDES